MGALTWGALTLAAGAQKNSAASTLVTAPVAAQEGEAETQTVVSHITFGAHTRADQPCASCHDEEPGGEIACRSCHGDVCGKDATTVSDCIECHKSGTTDDWTGSRP